MPFWWVYPVAAALVLSIVLTDAFRVLAIKFGFVDLPVGERKKHQTAMPTLGGVGIYLSFAAVTLAVLYFTDHFTSGDMTARTILGFLLGGLVLIVGGVIDDKYNLKPWQSILFPIVAALIAACAGLGPSKITNPFGTYFEVSTQLAFIFTFIWLLGMSYTTKLLDGIDGLAAGVVAIGTLMISFLALSHKYFQPDVALLALIAFAALLGFILWNFHPAQIFLGEGGSTFIGYLLGGLAIISGSKVATALLVMGIPALDVAFVIFRRWRAGTPIFSGDRRHLHHQLSDLGLSQRKLVLIYYFLSILFGITTLIFESWQKLIALAILFIIMLVVAIGLPKTKK